MSSVLVTVSGTVDPDIEDQISRGDRPTADYYAMARDFPADLMDYALARKIGGQTGRMLERIGGRNLMLAWACFARRAQYRAIVTDGEQVGIWLGLLFKLARTSRPRHLMISHYLSVPKKLPFFDFLHVQDQIDTFLVYSSWQKAFIESRWHVPEQDVVLSPFMVDADFFSPYSVVETEKVSALARDGRPIICAVGLEFRDYATLMSAVEGMDLLLIIAAASPWSKREDKTAHQTVPPNVIVDRFSQFELRHLYGLSQFMVMPLFDVDFQAGVTAILEAMSMGKAVICSRTRGQTDIVVEGETGLYVVPEDSTALRKAIQCMLDNTEWTQTMGANGRKLVEERLNLNAYVAQLGSYL